MAGKSKPMENRSDFIGNGALDFAACSPVPQPTAPPRAPVINIRNLNTWRMQYYMTIK